MLRTADFDFELPAELIAQNPLPVRSASRLLIVPPANVADPTGYPVLQDGCSAASPEYAITQAATIYATAAAEYDSDSSARVTTPGPPFEDCTCADLPRMLRPGDLLVFNDTRVLKARLFAHKESGGAVELLVERLDSEPDQAWAHCRASHPLRPGSFLVGKGGWRLQVLERVGGLYRVRLTARGKSSTALNSHSYPNASAHHLAQPQLAPIPAPIPAPPPAPAHPSSAAAQHDFAMWMEVHGQLPLPPYITRSPETGDEERYQTVYARHPGAVAAPTAGLHFDRVLLDQLRAGGVEMATVTLHVGAGTFQPVRSEWVRDHVMHRERYLIPPETISAIARTRANAGRVVAVGTTALRALEAAALLRAGASSNASPLESMATGAWEWRETALFITPGFHFQVVDMLLTNFHLPRSTLLMLVSAFAGSARIRTAYAHAVAQRYRFFSYGDAMLLTRAPTEPQTSAFPAEPAPPSPASAPPVPPSSSSQSPSPGPGAAHAL